MISGKATEIQEVFDSLITYNSDIRGCILLADDGLVLVSTFATGIREETIAALSVGVKSYLNRYLEAIGWKDFSNIVITGQTDDSTTATKEHIFIKNIDGIGILAVLINAGVDWIKLKAGVNHVTAQISDLNQGA
jgi:predicted regulator of Ras-like GTPase activity (Roadblock/LC7/MglB family)